MMMMMSLMMKLYETYDDGDNKYYCILYLVR